MKIGDRVRIKEGAVGNRQRRVPRPDGGEGVITNYEATAPALPYRITLDSGVSYYYDADEIDNLTNSQ